MRDCDDSLLCTADHCVAANDTGCTHTILPQVCGECGLCTPSNATRRNNATGCTPLPDDTDCASPFPQYACANHSLGQCVDGTCFTRRNHSLCSDRYAHLVCVDAVCDPSGQYGTPDAYGCSLINRTDGTPCPSPNPCFFNATCTAGACDVANAVPVVCNITAVAACVSISCVPERGGCVALPNTSHCAAPPHNDSCLIPHCDVVAGCVYANRSCSDNNLCTYGDYCANNTCHPGRLQLCANESVANQCAVTRCNQTDGQCSLAPHPSLGSPCVAPPPCTRPGRIVCSDSLQLVCAPNATDPTCAVQPCNTTADCTPASFCSSVACNTTAHVCVYAQRNDSATVCNDANPCTYDYCDLASDTCAHDTLLFTGLPCANPNLCVHSSICFLGNCAFGSPVQCAANSSNGCQSSVCTPLVGCVTVTHVNRTCDTIPHQNDCIADGRCAANGTCVGQVPTDALCPSVPCRTVQCSPNGTCIYADVPVNTPCVPTTNISCQSGGLCAGHHPAMCIPVLNDSLCDDGNPCSRDQCDLFAEACVHTPATSTTLCELPCFYLAECSDTNLTCVGLVPVDCTDANDDDDLCTTRTCSSGFTCDNVTTVTCSVNYTCVPATGLCEPDFECVGKRVGELCRGGDGYCYLGTCYECPNANSNDLIATLVFERLSSDIVRLQLCNRSSVIDVRVWTFLHSAAFYAARNMTTCDHLLYVLLRTAANVTSLVDAALLSGPCPTNITSVRAWPPSLYFGWLVHEDVHEPPLSDYDYNDFVLAVRVTHAYSTTRLLASFIELYPVARGSFYTHEFRMTPYAPSVNESAGLTHWTYRRRFASNGTLIATPAVNSPAPAPIVLIPNTATILGLQGIALPMSQRIANTLASQACYSPREFWHLEAVAATPNSVAAQKRPPEPCAVGTYLPFRLQRIPASVPPSPLGTTMPIRFAANASGTTLFDANSTVPSLFVSNPRFRFTNEHVRLSTLCPLFANCTSRATCCSGAWEFACFFNNTALARHCN